MLTIKEHSLNQTYLLLGSNIEPRLGFLEEAEKRMSRVAGNVIKRSGVYESEPWGFSAETSFLNRVLLMQTILSPEELLRDILLVEMDMGRVRNGKGYTSRNIDIDILYYNDLIMSTDELVIPHPRLHFRRFALLPLAEIAPAYVHPLLLSTNEDLLQKCNDTTTVRKFKGIPDEV